MIFIIGGACQGKYQVGCSLANVEEAVFRDACVDGACDSIEGIKAGRYINHYHELIRKLLLVGGDTDAFTKELCEREPEIVIMNEVGYGIVPLDTSDRAYREAVGRAGQLLANHASAVYRVVCGIPVKIS